MQSPSLARVMATLTWLGSMMKPSLLVSHALVGLLSISDPGQERTVDNIT